MTAWQAKQTDHDGYILFRRAIVECDGAAWAKITECYRALLIAWAIRFSHGIQVNVHFDAIADQALARAWMAISAADFCRFPNLAAVLAYLRSCVIAVVIDAARVQRVDERIKDKLEISGVDTPEDIVMSRMQQNELWQTVTHHIKTVQERVILYESFALNLPPRIIFTRHPELFPSIVAVYSAKRNLLNRLQRSHELQALWREMQTS